MSTRNHHGATDQLASGNPDFPDASERTSGVKTVTIQKQYAQKLRGRFAAINAEARRAIVERDVLGLADDGTAQLAGTGNWDPETLTPDDFPRGDGQRTRAFMSWLRRQHAQGTLTVISDGRNVYVQRAYEAGEKKANRHLKEAGAEIDVDDGRPGASRVATAFNRPQRIEHLDLLYSRNYDQLQGITEDHAQNINRVLTESLVAGANPLDVGELITEQTNLAKNRATALARYELQYAHNTAALDRYDDYGVSKVEVIGSSPCPSCTAIIAGNPYPVAEARGLVPDHPNCMCTVVVAEL